MRRALAVVGRGGLFVLLAFFFVAALLSLADRAAERWFVGDPTHSGIAFPPETTIAMRTAEYACVARTNRLGFRDREFAPRTAAGKTSPRRAVALGDSFTYGWGVAIEEAWPKVLEDRLRAAGQAIEVADLGVPDAGPAVHAVVAARAVSVLSPDLVIVGLRQGDDLGQALETRTWEHPDRRFADPVRRFAPSFFGWVRQRRLARDVPAEHVRIIWSAQAARFVQSLGPEERARYDAIDAFARREFAQGALNPGVVIGAIRHPRTFLDVYGPRGARTAEAVTRLAASLAAIRDVAARHGAAVVVASVPSGIYVNAPNHEAFRRLGYTLEPDMLVTTWADDPVREACGIAGLPFWSGTDAFRARRDDAGLFFALDGHPTRAGHALFAAALADEIVRHPEWAKGAR
jgi:hypothetical protein